MSCLTPARRSCSTFRGNGLGFSTACGKETCVAGAGAPCAPCAPCVDACAAAPPNRAARLCNNVSHPRAYDAMALPGLLAFPFTHNAVWQPTTGVMTTRIVRAVARGGWTYACGYAAVPANSNDGLNEWTDEGFVCMLRMGAATGAVAPTPTNVCVLRSVDALGVTQRLLLPRGLVTAQATCVVVVGNGDAEYADGSTASSGPAIAVVPVSGCGGIGAGAGGGGGSSCAVLPAPTVYVFTYLGEGAAFYDALWHHDNPSWLVVAGSLGGDAVLWTIDVTTWAIVATATLTPDSVNALQLNAVSVTHVCGMYVAGVHVTEIDSEAPTQSLLWPVADGTFTTLAPWLATSYNTVATPDTPRLQLAAGATTALVLRVFGVANTGALLAAALVGFDQSSGAPLPAHGVAVYAFTADTAPDAAFGVDGVVTWFDAELGTTRPTDAVLLLASECAPAVAVVGSAFATEVVTPAPDLAPVIDVPGFPYLNVYMAADEDGELPVPAPVPFAVAVGATGVTTLVRGLGAAHDCCSPPYRWLGAVAQPAPNALALLGDVCWHPGCPSQSASLLAVFLALSCPPRILNGQTVAVPVIANNCDGRVEVDARCAPTTLLVRGGLVLGCDALPLPGSLRFNVRSDRLEVYTQDGQWHAVAFEIVPP